MTEVSATRLYLGNMPKGGESAAFACPRLVVLVLAAVPFPEAHVAMCSAVPRPYLPCLVASYIETRRARRDSLLTFSLSRACPSHQAGCRGSLCDPWNR